MNINDIFTFVEKQYPKIAKLQNDFALLGILDVLVENLMDKGYRRKIEALLEECKTDIEKEYTSIDIKGVILEKKEETLGDIFDRVFKEDEK